MTFSRRVEDELSPFPLSRRGFRELETHVWEAGFFVTRRKKSAKWPFWFCFAFRPQKFRVKVAEDFAKNKPLKSNIHETNHISFEEKKSHQRTGFRLRTS